MGKLIAYNGCKYEIGGEIETPPCQIEIMFNRSRWANKTTTTPLFYICCCSAFLSDGNKETCKNKKR